MQDNAVVLPQTARRALAAYLLDLEQEKPEDIHSEIWRGLVHAEVAYIDFPTLGVLCDELGYDILDVLRWPNASNWPENAGPAGVMP